jgi:toxin ParE1/3/4
MIHPLIIRPEAEEDMAEGRDWYERHQQGLGTEFLTAIEEVFDRIRDTPKLYTPEYKSVRRVGLNRFPYVVYYRIVVEGIEVITVQHASRNPRGWRRRV